VGSAAQIKAIKQVAGTTKLDLAQFRDLQAFAQFGSDVDPGTRKKLDRGQRIVELFKQAQHDPMPVEMQVVLLFAAQKGYFDDVPVDKVRDCKAKMREYFLTRQEGLLKQIVDKRAIDKDLEGALQAAIKDFKTCYRP
jgi:F-type H+/Na+-transporting ATPase subunit alpha